MKTRPSFLRYSLNLLASLLLLLGGAAAQAQTVIDALPYTISAPGTYVLNSNLNSSMNTGTLITINASNVTVDFRNHYISGPAGDTGQIVQGVYAFERSNITIKNGTVANCDKGIFVGGDQSATSNSVNHQIDRMRVTYCLTEGIYVSYSPASRITRCQVSQCGLPTKGQSSGIFANGPGTTVQDNVVSTILGTHAVGIAASTGSFVRRNTVSNAVYGIYGGKYQDNLTANCTVAFTPGADAGGNN